MAVLTSTNATEGLNMATGNQFTFDGQDPGGANTATQYSWLSPDGSDVQAYGSGFTWTSPSGDPLTGTVTALEFDFNNDNFAVPDVEISGFSGDLVTMTTGSGLLNEVFGGNDTINGTDFADTIKGVAGADSIEGNNGADLIYGDAALAGAGDGNDTIRGGSGNDTIFGGGGNDNLNGNSGSNEVDGQGGNDVITEGGSDTIDGGAGNDRIVVTSSSVASGFDEFHGGADNDILDLRGITYSGTTVEVDLLNGVIESANGVGVGDVISGFETVYGSDGSETIRGDNLANYLWGGDQGTASDTIFGNGGNDTLYGNSGGSDDSIRGGDDNDQIYGRGGDDYLAGDSGNDFIRGEAGNDSLFGNTGNDTLRGGTGDDSIRGNSGTNRIDYLASEAATHGTDTVEGGSGTDTIFLSGAASYNMSSFQLSGLEGITFGDADGAFTLTLAADEVNDGFTGGALVTGDSGVGSSHFIAIDMGVDTTIDLSSWTFANWDSADEIDIDGDASSETFTGSSQRDDISGGDGFNTYILNGAGSEADSIRGGAGTDRLQVLNTTDMSSTDVQFQSIDEIEFSGSVAGTRTFMINAQELDNVTEISSTLVVDGWSGGGTQDVIHITMGAVNTIDLSGWTFQDWGGEGEFTHIVGDSSAENITGTVENDLIEGNGGNDTLNGDAGDDTIIGGTGTDIMDGGAGVDLIDYSGTNTAFDVNMATGVTSVAETATNFEYLLVGDGDNEIIGNSAANEIFTNAGNDTIFGGGGNDSLYAGNNDDWLYGEAGDDLLQAGGGLDFLEGGLGADTLQGGNGRDTAIYTNSAGAVFIDMVNATYVGGDATGDLLLNIEDVFGSQGNDTLLGNGVSNTLTGDVGRDLLDGGTGAFRDVLSGGANQDTLISRDGNDIVNGGGGTDVLDAGAGNDLIVGGTGNDDLTGGSGNDVFIFATGWGNDTITDWEDGLDRARVVTAFSAADVTLTQIGSDVLFEIGTLTDTILFENVTVAQLDPFSADFGGL